MEVPGERPMSRFGAGMSILDTDGQGILYLTGGVTRNSAGAASSSPTMELNDLYLFQLRDPFFRRCSATGKGLISATAGQNTPFFVACTDLLGKPAMGAQFHVSILPGAACAGCPSAYPPVLAIGIGLYRCTYTPTVAGEYEIHIRVGRGGTKYQEAVGGDPTAETSTDDATIRSRAFPEGCVREHGVRLASLLAELVLLTLLGASCREQLKTNRDFFELLVLAAPTNQMASIASGQGLTLTTSGPTVQMARHVASSVSCIQVEFILLDNLTWAALKRGHTDLPPLESAQLCSLAAYVCFITAERWRSSYAQESFNFSIPLRFRYVVVLVYFLQVAP